MAFPIKCGDCKKSFSISDDVYNRKVRGKLVTIKCKSCGAAIRVDGTKDAAGSKPPTGATDESKIAAAAAEPAQSAAKDKPATAAKAGAPKAPAGNDAAKPAAEDARKANAARAGTAKNAPTPADKATSPSKETEPKAPAKVAEPALKVTRQPQKPLISSPTKPQATRDLSASAREQRAAKTEETARSPGLTKGLGPQSPRARATGTEPAGPAGKAAPRARALASEEKPEPAPLPRPSAAIGRTARESEPADALDSMLWAVDYGESEHRELSTSEIEQEIEKGTLDGQTLVWHDNMPDWLAIRDVKELRSFVEKDKDKNKPKPVPRSAPRAAKSSPKVTARDNGLPAAPKAAPLPPVGPLSSRPPPPPPGAPSPPKVPPTRAPLPPPKKVRGTSDEGDEVVTSVRLLDDATEKAAANPFADLASSPVVASPPSSLTGALAPAGPAPAAPPPTAQPPTPQVGPAPTAAAAASFAAPGGFPAATAAPQGPMAQAPVPNPFAPAAPGPMQSQALPATPASSLGDMDEIQWPKRSKKPLVFGAIGVVALVLVGWLLMSGSDEPAAPSGAPNQMQAASPIAEPAPAQPAAPSPTPTPQPAETSNTAPTEEAPAPPSTPTGDRKSGDFADMFERSAKTSE